MKHPSYGFPHIYPAWIWLSLFQQIWEISGQYFFKYFFLANYLLSLWNSNLTYVRVFHCRYPTCSGSSVVYLFIYSFIVLNIFFSFLQMRYLQLNFLYGDPLKISSFFYKDHPGHFWYQILQYFSVLKFPLRSFHYFRFSFDIFCLCIHYKLIFLFYNQAKL